MRSRSRDIHALIRNLVDQALVTMQTGTAKMFNSERGFGFITRDAGGTDIFFHVDQVDESIDVLFRGQRVSFEEGLSPKSGRPGS